jgi:hypothetical protein
MPFPHITFYEKHTNDIIWKVLEKLAPKLLDMGYVFFDEYSPDTQLPALIKEIENRIRLTERLIKDFQRLRLDYKKASDREKYLMNYAMRPDPAYSVGYMRENISMFMEKYQANLSFLSFLKTLRFLRMKYQGVDHPLFKIGYGSKDGDVPLAERDALMSDAYLKAKHPVVGRNGFAHAPGMQTAFLKTRTKEEAEAQFLSVHIEQDITADDKPILDEIKAEISMQVLTFNAKKKSVDSIANTILQQIQKKQAELEKLSAQKNSRGEEQKLNSQFVAKHKQTLVPKSKLDLLMKCEFGRTLLRQGYLKVKELDSISYPKLINILCSEGVKLFEKKLLTGPDLATLPDETLIELLEQERDSERKPTLADSVAKKLVYF